MTPEQHDHILTVIDKDANGSHYLAQLSLNGKEEEVCILGGLAMEAGFSFKQLLGKLLPRNVRVKVDGLTLTQHLDLMFGLTPSKRNMLQTTNDRWDDLVTIEGQHKSRRARLRDLVESWDVVPMSH